MTEALERAAGALIEWDEAQSPTTGRYGFDPNDAQDIVRAVLLAVREPEEWLEEVGAPYTDNVLPGSAFTAMIDAILGETK